MKKNYACEILDELVEIIPELKSNYEEAKAEAISSYRNLSPEDKQEIENICRIHNLPETDEEAPGAWIFLEMKASPYILQIASDPARSKQFLTVMNWLEAKAGDSNFWVRNEIAIGFCEGLMTNDREHFATIFRCMGPNLKQICKNMLEQYHVTKEMLDLLNQNSMP